MSTRREILLAPEQARYLPNDITFEHSGGASSAKVKSQDAQDSGMSRELNSINLALAPAINLSAFPYGLAKTAAAAEPVAAASTASNDLCVCAARRHRLALQVPTGSSRVRVAARIVLSVTPSTRPFGKNCK